MITRDDINALARAIARRFDPERIILFGSHAYGQPTEDSDVDLVVVMEYEGRALDKTVEILDAVRAPFPLDLLLYRPGDFDRRAALFDPIPHEAAQRGQVLHDADRSRVAV